MDSLLLSVFHRLEKLSHVQWRAMEGEMPVSYSLFPGGHYAKHAFDPHHNKSMYTFIIFPEGEIFYISISSVL